MDRGVPKVVLVDPLGAAPRPIVLNSLEFRIARQLDGARTLAEIGANLDHGDPASSAHPLVAQLVERLEQSLLLEGPAFESFLEEFRLRATRSATFAGRSYPADPLALRAQLDSYYASDRGAGVPGEIGSSRRPIRGILSPHIDFARGGPTYTWAYRRLIETCDADVFVILGVAHQPCRNRFVLTRKPFETPLGLVATDIPFVDRVAELAGEHLFEDEIVHRSEHSIEFQAVFLQHLLGGGRPFRIVPILVSSFHDLMEQAVDPIQDTGVRSVVEATRQAERELGARVAYIGGIDLCHVGPEFGDPRPVDDRTLDAVRAFDLSMLRHASTNNPAGWFGTASAVDNRWRVCGLAATYTMLHAMGPTRGEVLRYDQAVSSERDCCVSFASVAFESLT